MVNNDIDRFRIIPASKLKHDERQKYTVLESYFKDITISLNESNEKTVQYNSYKILNENQNSLDKMISILKNIKNTNTEQEITKIKNNIYSLELINKEYGNWLPKLLVDKVSENSLIDIQKYVKNETKSSNSQINIIVDQIIAYFMKIIWYQWNILFIFITLLKGFKYFDENKQNCNFKSLEIDQVLIGPKQDLLFVLMPENGENKMNNLISGLIEKFISYFPFLKEKEFEVNSVNQKDILTADEFLRQKVLSLLNNLTKLAKHYMNEKAINSILDIKRTNKFTGTYISEIASPKNIMSNILFIILNKIPVNREAMFQMLYSSINYYIENVGNLHIKKSFEDFIKIYNSKESSSQNLTGSIKQQFFLIFDDIKKQGKYFYLDTFFHILITNLLDQDLLNSKKYEIIKKYNMNNMHYIRDLRNFNDINSLSQLYFDNELNFYIIKIYAQDFDQEKLEREKKILSNKYSKFIVHTDENMQSLCNNRICIPYFPCETLETLILNRYSKSSKNGQIDLTFVDKIVIILEIATALNDLHSHDEFYGNLSDQYILINATKDAYIGSFYYNSDSEKNISKLRGSLYYRSPESFNNDTNQVENDDDYEYIHKKQLSDIYSLGVLMYEIITDTPPEKKMGNSTRNDKLNIIQKKYKEFLFSGENNECFESNYVDSRGDSLIGIKEIIVKCLNISNDDRYSSMDDLINSLKELPIYILNKEEIEYRLSNSMDARNYKCKIADIVESYYRGNTNANCYINEFLEIIKKLLTNDDTIEFNDDIAKNIFDTFDIKYNEDFTYIFEDIFDHIIQMISKSKIDETKSFDYNDKLLNLSNYANIYHSLSENEQINEQLKDFIIPISSLDNFIKYNKNQISNLIPTWIYILAKELQYIHSKNIYHGSLSSENIGIYYNNETQTFIPSFILFYSFFNQLKNNQQNETDFIQNEYCSIKQIIQKAQKNDLKQLVKIIKSFNIIPEETMQLLKVSKSINQIVNILYNFNLKNSNEVQKKFFVENNSITSFASFQITFSVLKNILKLINKNFSLKGSFIEIDLVLKIINEFLYNLNNNPEKSINECIPKNLISENEGQSINQIIDKYEITKQFSDINSKCSLLFYNVLDEKEKIYDLSIDIKSEDDKTIYITKKKNANNLKSFIKNKSSNNLKLMNLWYHKKLLKISKAEKLSEREVFRYVEFYGLCRKSFEFLLRRYILNLNPAFKYRITIKLINHIFLSTTDEPIKLFHVKKIINSINNEWKDPEGQDATIIIYVNIYKTNISS